jgi:hypothetical protein
MTTNLDAVLSKVRQSVEAKAAGIETPAAPVEKPLDVIEKDLSEVTVGDEVGKLAKADISLREYRKKLEEQRKQHEKDLEELARYRKGDEVLKKDPIKALEMFGLGPDKLRMLIQEENNPSTAQERKVMAAIEEMKREMREREEKYENERRTREQKNIMNVISKTVQEKEYDIIESMGAENEVYEYIEAYYDETGSAPTVEEACEAIAEEIYSKIQKSASTKYYSKRTGSQPKETIKEEPKKEEPKKKATLMNKMTATTERVEERSMDKARELALAAARKLVTKSHL